MFSQSFEHCKMPTGTERVVSNPVHSSEINKIFYTLPTLKNNKKMLLTSFHVRFKNRSRKFTLNFDG